MKKTLTTIAALACMSLFGAVQPEYIDHCDIEGDVRICTNVVEYLDSRLQNIDSTASLTNVSFDVLLNDVTKTNNSTVSRIWTLEQTPSVPMWDLFLTKAETIGTQYRGAWNLRSVTSSSSANTMNINSMAFAYLPNLKTVKIGKVGTIQNDSFYGCSLDELRLDGVTTVGGYGNSAYGCTTLKKIASYTATTINIYGAELAGWRNLEEVDCPNLTSIGDYCFNGSQNIKDFHGSFSNVTWIGGAAFSDFKSPNVKVLDFPKLTNLGNSGFARMQYVEELYLTNVTTSAGGYGTFTSCPRLRKCIFSSKYTGVVGPGWFQSDPMLEDVGDMSGVTSIGGGGFAGTAITEINIPNVTWMGESALADCTKLTNVISLASLRSCGSTGHFSGCTKLKNVGENNTIPLLTQIPGGMFSDCAALTELHFPSATNLTVNGTFKNCYNISTIDMPALRTLRQNGSGWYWPCFNECKRLRNLTFGTLEAITSNELAGIGSSLTPDAEGVKCIVTVGNTCESLRTFASFPFGAPTQTKFVCSDGHIWYRNGAWVTELD